MSAAPAVQSLNSIYAQHVNPQWVRLLDLLQMNAAYEKCCGAELFSGGGRRILDFLSPLIVTEEQIDEFVEAIRDTVDLAHNSAGFWTEALGLARRASNI